MKRLGTMLLVVLGCLLLASPGWARDLYLNGKLINGVRKQTFKNVTVRIDKKGNVYIVGKQYQVRYNKPKPAAGTKQQPPARRAPEAQPEARPTPRPAAGTNSLQPRPEKNYVVVAQRDVKNGSGYRINILLNGKKVRTILTQLPQDVFDVTKYLKKGANKLVVEAIKVNDKATGTFSMFLTVGSIKKGVVKVQKPYVFSYKREAKETRSYRHIYSIDIQ
ncbi:MAG: hypothetical protein EP343_31140 [Deltaproteobacteria bacterium]|nr:MAG: hypothetical protein EP343_31140 [Deltaproteobacteria bacterium]